jgi:hypothetical protein
MTGKLHKVMHDFTLLQSNLQAVKRRNGNIYLSGKSLFILHQSTVARQPHGHLSKGNKSRSSNLLRSATLSSFIIEVDKIIFYRKLSRSFSKLSNGKFRHFNPRVNSYGIVKFVC